MRTSTCHSLASLFVSARNASVSARKASIAAFGIAAVACLGGCPRDKEEPMTQAEAREAIDQSTVDSQAASLTTSSIEISTSFTIGKAVKESAAELSTFITSHLPCAEVSVAEATLSVTYGAKPGDCTYRGHEFTGQHTIAITKNEDVVEVDHTWKDLSNGLVKVSGTAHVEWDGGAKERRVDHELTWTRLSDGKTGKGSGSRTQKALSGGLDEGIQVDGDRSWNGSGGTWNLAIESVQMRWADPVPQAGTYRLASPKNRSLSLSFSRVDADTIEVNVSNGNRSFKFNVNATGAVADK